MSARFQQILTITDFKDEILSPDLHDLESKYSNLENIAIEPIEPLSPPGSLSSSLQIDVLRSWSADNEEDWTDLDNDILELDGPDSKTWNWAEDHGHKELARSPQPDPLLGALLHLGLGQESIFFIYREHSFVPRRDTLRSYGYTLESLETLIGNFIAHGNCVREINDFVDRVYRSPETFPTMLAFAETVSSALSFVMVKLSHLVDPPRSLDHLLLAFNRPGMIFTCLSDLVGRIRTVGTEKDLLSRLYACAQDQNNHIDLPLRPIVLQILRKVSRPWLKSVGTSIGLQLEDIGLHGSLRDALDARTDGLDPESRILPTFLSLEDEAVIAQTSQGLHLLETHSPDHVLNSLVLNQDTVLPDFDMYFNWDDIERIQKRAREYEASVLKAIEAQRIPSPRTSPSITGSNSPRTRSLWPFGATEASIQARITGSQKRIQSSMCGPRLLPYETILHQFLEDAVSGNKSPTYKSYASISPSLSIRPIISVQARLVNLACLRMLFKQHKLRSHLSLLHRYQLFGDGVFSSNLSHVLFDPEPLTSDASHSRANSDLYTSLMDVLMETYQYSPQSKILRPKDGNLPGGLSFAVREASRKRRQDPDSVEAWDFLSLQYKPSPPLDVVITKVLLEKYGSIYKLLLKMTRMQFVVNHQLSSIASSTHLRRQRNSLVSFGAGHFRLEAQHFISVLCTHFLTNGIHATWTNFNSELDDLEKKLEKYDDLSEHDSIFSLRDKHEIMLNCILDDLLLGNGQEKAMRLLGDICNLILRFAKAQSDSMNQLHQEFRAKVAAFMQACRDLNPSKVTSENICVDTRQGALKVLDDDNDGSDDEDEGGPNEREYSSLDMLLLKLDMNGFYS